MGLSHNQVRFRSARLKVGDEFRLYGIMKLKVRFYDRLTRLIYSLLFLRDSKVPVTMDKAQIMNRSRYERAD